MNERDDEIIYAKIKKALDSSLKVHLRLKDATWRNGFVQKVFVEFFTFKDDKNDEEPIFFLELKDVEPYVEDGR